MEIGDATVSIDAFTAHDRGNAAKVRNPALIQ
jgi:hypothetical protein